MSWFEHMLGKVSPDRFAQRLMDELRHAGDERKVVYDAAEFQLKFTSGGQDVGFANLRNLHNEFQSVSAGDRDRFFRFAVRSLLAAHKPIPDEFEDACCDILLTVRNRAYFSLPELRYELTCNEQAARPRLFWPHQTLAEQLGVGLVYDLPEAMLMLQSSHLSDWNVSFYEVYEHALANLSELDATFATIDDYSYVSNTGDHYDSSRMILTDLMAELEVKGDPVVLLPNRDRLIVTGSEDRQGLETASLISQQLMDHPRPISGQAFIRIDAEWSPWLPDTDHPAYSVLKSLALSTLQNDYAEQHQILLALHDRWPAERMAPAAFRVHDAGTRQPPFSYCVWKQGPNRLLPKTDRICFLGEDEDIDHPLVESINVAWPQAMRVVGEWLEEQPDDYPPRFRTLGFPSADQLDLLAHL